jgi:hypothetical protein
VKCRAAGASDRGYSNSGTVNCAMASACRGQSSTAKGIGRPCSSWNIRSAIRSIDGPKAALLWAAVTAAAHGDREVRGLLAERLALIRGQVENVLRRVAERGWLRTDVPFDDLVQVLCVITRVETYVRCVHLDGKPPEEYQAFVTRTVRDPVLLPGPRT